MPGQRIFDQKSEKIDRFALILKGKVGIFYPDQTQVKNCMKTPNRTVVCAETEIEITKKRRERQNVE